MILLLVYTRKHGISSTITMGIRYDEESLTADCLHSFVWDLAYLSLERSQTVAKNTEMDGTIV